MKRDCLTSPKLYSFAGRLSIGRAQAIGHLELLWDFTAAHAIAGDIGKWDDIAIATACDWQGDATFFVHKLVESRFLDECDVHRLVVHDWSVHCENWVRAKASKLEVTLLKRGLKSPLKNEQNGTPEATQVPTEEPSSRAPVPSLAFTSLPKPPPSEALSSVGKSKTVAGTSRKNGASEPAPTSETWDAYSEAYEERYQTKPVRNAKVNSILAQFIQRVPVSEAPSIASWFVWHNGRWYVEKGHSVECLLKDAEALRTQWKTGKAVTSHKAREADRLQGTGDMWREIKDELRAEGKLT